MGDPASWKKHNTNWDYRFWTDESLSSFIAAHFPELSTIYEAYPNPVMRADLARYCLMYQFGGIYADVDTDCQGSLEEIAGDTRAIFCDEPRAHWGSATIRGLPCLVFNGTFASPAGHPVWRAMIEACVFMAHNENRLKNDVLEQTGPLLLTSVLADFADKSMLSMNSCHLFAPADKKSVNDENERFGPHGHLQLSVHRWAGSWYRVRNQSRRSWLLGRLRHLLHSLTSGQTLSFAQATRTIDVERLKRPIVSTTDTPSVVIFVPVRNGCPFIERCVELITALDHPKHLLRVVFCEGDSTDGSAELLKKMCVQNTPQCKEMTVIHCATGNKIERSKRWLPKHQRQRRSDIAKVRNTLIRQAIHAEDDWVLWLDVDVCDFPFDILKTLLLEKTKIVTPNCVQKPGGKSFDLNSFLETGQTARHTYFKHTKHGLFQPPANLYGRRHLDDLRYLKRVPLHGVGGTMLLVHADLHRAGLIFPEVPYKDLIETEAFGVLARDLGILPIGLPRVEIIHVST